MTLRRLAVVVLAAAILAACGTSNSDSQAAATKLCQQLHAQAVADARSYLDQLTAAVEKSHIGPLTEATFKAKVTLYNVKHPNKPVQCEGA
jgi:outer membrane PBP1 activator LpoA protein